MHRDVCQLLWILTFTSGLGVGVDMPFVFSDDTPPLEGLDSEELQDLASSAPELAGVPEISEVPDDELMEFAETGGAGGAAGGKAKMTLGEMKDIFNSRVVVDDPTLRGKAARLASRYPGDLSLHQICAIFEFLKNGDEAVKGWQYVEDPRGVDYYAYSNETLVLGSSELASGIGDCDDFAILMAAMVESIGGATRIILAYNQTLGHAYTEVYLGCLNTDAEQVETVIAALKDRYAIEEVFTHIDVQNGDVWLNLDWGPDRDGVAHPGGPFFTGDEHIPLLIREIYNKKPVKPPKGFRPALPAIQNAEMWMKTFGGVDLDSGHSVRYTKDGGYVIAGYTRSYGAGANDIWLIKTNSYGEEMWNKTFGGYDSDFGWSVQETNDGGYAIAGETYSYGVGINDLWLIKTNSYGEEMWNKTFGGTNADGGWSLHETSDAGYVVIGSTNSSIDGRLDVWLIKTDSSGNEMWNKTFGGNYDDCGYSVQETSYGGYRGYILAGYTDSYGSGGSDVWLIKTDSSGNEMWNKTFGGTYDDCGYSVQETSDAGYIITGYKSASYYDGREDVWLIKTDSVGNEVWNKTFGGLNSDVGYSVQETIDDGFVIAGYTSSYGAGYQDVWLIKTDSFGNEMWSKTFGGLYGDYGYSVQEANDSTYVIASGVGSYGAGGGDVWLIVTDSEGDVNSSLSRVEIIKT